MQKNISTYLLCEPPLVLEYSLDFMAYNNNDLRQKPMSERGERTEKSIPADLEYLRKAVYSKSPFDTNESILSPQID